MRLDIFVTFCLTKRPSEREFWHFCPNSFVTFFNISVIGSFEDAIMSLCEGILDAFGPAISKK